MRATETMLQVTMEAMVVMVLRVVLMVVMMLTMVMLTVRNDRHSDCGQHLSLHQQVVLTGVVHCQVSMHGLQPPGNLATIRVHGDKQSMLSVPCSVKFAVMC